MTTCSKCKRPYGQGLWVAPDPWTYCDDPVVCDAMTVAYRRGVLDGIAAAKRSAYADKYGGVSFHDVEREAAKLAGEGT